MEALRFHLCLSFLFQSGKCVCKLVGVQIYLLKTLSIPLSILSICNFEGGFSTIADHKSSKFYRPSGVEFMLPFKVLFHHEEVKNIWWKTSKGKLERLLGTW